MNHPWVDEMQNTLKTNMLHVNTYFLAKQCPHLSTHPTGMLLKNIRHPRLYTASIKFAFSLTVSLDRAKAKRLRLLVYMIR